MDMNTLSMEVCFKSHIYIALNKIKWIVSAIPICNNIKETIFAIPWNTRIYAYFYLNNWIGSKPKTFQKYINKYHDKWIIYSKWWIHVVQ